MSEKSSIIDVLKEISELYKTIYLHSMITEKDQTVDNIKRTMHIFLDKVIDSTHDRYIDHVEGIKKTKIG